ncbi:hypothetical protein G6F46_013573 [Rhizopus delemar]|nr:hypothetical protein G6F46_013573 [Rhizopus delemar]
MHRIQRTVREPRTGLLHHPDAIGVGHGVALERANRLQRVTIEQVEHAALLALLGGDPPAVLATGAQGHAFGLCLEHTLNSLA